MSGQAPAQLKKVGVKLNLGELNVSGTWEADESEQQAAWELYVELITRIAVEELKPNEGLLREALSSLYALFGETRKILRKYGASVARPKGRGRLSLGHIAVAVLNSAIRPVLAYWHPELLAYESTRSANVSPTAHECAWNRNDELRKALKDLQGTLLSYSYLLAKAAGIPPIPAGRRH